LARFLRQTESKDLHFRRWFLQPTSDSPHWSVFQKYVLCQGTTSVVPPFHPQEFRNQPARRVALKSRSTTKPGAHPCGALVFAARVGNHDLKEAAFVSGKEAPLCQGRGGLVSGHDFSRAVNAQNQCGFSPAENSIRRRRGFKPRIKPAQITRL